MGFNINSNKEINNFLKIEQMENNYPFDTETPNGYEDHQEDIIFPDDSIPDEYENLDSKSEKSETKISCWSTRKI